MGAGGANEKPSGLTERQQKWFASVQAMTSVCPRFRVAREKTPSWSVMAC